MVPVPVRVEHLPAVTRAQSDKITPAELIAAGIVNGKQPVKILANGTLTKKLEVVANAFSATAEKAITELGGTVTKI